MTAPDLLDFSHNKLFQGVPPAALEQISQIPTPTRFAADDVIFEEGDPAGSFFLITSGTVRISKRGRGGRQENLSYLEAGEFFGEMALYDPAPRSAQATAATDTTLGRVDPEGFQRILELAPSEICANLTRVIIQRLRRVDQLLIHELMEAERLSLIGSMASSIMHDLKNPLSVILGAADLMADRSDDPALLRYAGMIRRSVDTMVTMTGELLDFSRGRSVLRLEVVPVYDLMEELDEQMLSRLPDAGIRVERHMSYTGELVVDRTRFIRLLLNIIRNAAEAMPGGGLLEIGVEAVGDQIRFAVSDTGCGIPSDILPTIFEPFVTHGKTKGTGLGMAIAKSVVEAHHGKISVTSTPGEGTRFVVSIPAGGATLLRSAPAVARS